MSEKDRDKDRTALRKEIRIAIFWRKLITDYEYVRFNPDDVLRWHLGMELHGTEEIRDLMHFRYSNGARRTPVLGVVDESPHPPVWIVREWLGTRVPVFPKWRIFFMSCSFVTLAGIFAPVLYGCHTMHTMNPLAYMPPPTQPNMMQLNSKVTVQVPPALGTISIPSFSTNMQAVSPVLGGGQSPRASAPQMGVPSPAAAPSSSGAAGAGSTNPTNSGISGNSQPP